MRFVDGYSSSSCFKKGHPHDTLVTLSNKAGTSPPPHWMKWSTMFRLMLLKHQMGAIWWHSGEVLNFLLYGKYRLALEQSLDPIRVHQPSCDKDAAEHLYWWICKSTFWSLCNRIMSADQNKHISISPSTLNNSDWFCFDSKVFFRYIHGMLVLQMVHNLIQHFITSIIAFLH